MNEGKIIDLLFLADAEHRAEMPEVLDIYRTCLMQVHRLLSAQKDVLVEIEEDMPASDKQAAEMRALALQDEIKQRWRTCFEDISGRLFPV